MRIVASTVNAFMAKIDALVTFDSNMVTIDGGTATGPILWVKTSAGTAVPVLLIENTIHDANSQTQLFLKRWTAAGSPRLWQMAVDVDNNGGFEALCNLESIDLSIPGVKATPISMDWATGIVGIGGLPLAGTQMHVHGSLNLVSGSAFKINATQVVAARKTGWATATGTATRTTFDTTTVTLSQLAERVKALIDDLHGTAGHGLIGT